jgi:hypothetical protein
MCIMHKNAALTTVVDLEMASVCTLRTVWAVTNRRGSGVADATAEVVGCRQCGHASVTC